MFLVWAKPLRGERSSKPGRSPDAVRWRTLGPSPSELNVEMTFPLPLVSNM